MIPMVIDKQEGPFFYDIYSRLLEDRIIFLGGEVTDEKANAVVAQLLYLDSADKTKDIWMYVNSPGGSVSAGLAIYDAMHFVAPEVTTLCVGLAASMGALLLAAGAPKKRFALPNARIMIHQPLGGAFGPATEVEIQTQEILRIKKRLNEILVEHTGQPFERIAADTERDFYLSAEDARKYGLIDKVITKKAVKK